MEVKTDNVQEQINQINQKLDLVLQYIHEQKLRNEVVEDLVKDVSIIGKDAFNTIVEDLDKQGIELNVDDLKELVFKFLRNIKNFSAMIDMLESMNDLAKDVGPIVTEMGVDLAHKLNEFEQKGYFEFIKEVGNVVDNIVTHYKPEEVRALAENVVTILDTVKNLTQPDMLKAMNNAINIFKNLDSSNVQEYTLWRAFREMNSPEMRRSIGFMMTFMKNLSKESIPNNR